MEVQEAMAIDEEEEYGLLDFEDVLIPDAEVEVAHPAMDVDGWDAEPDNDAQMMAEFLVSQGVQPSPAFKRDNAMMKAETEATTLFEAFGSGSITDVANVLRRDLNIEGLAVLDLRARKPERRRQR